MTTATLTLTDFLEQRLAEDEAWANASIKTLGAIHWHWVDAETDEPVEPDPFTMGYLDEDGRQVSLRTVEELRPVSWANGAPLPDFIIHSGEEVPAGAAGHIARHDPARVLAECAAKRAIVELHSGSHECPGGGPGGWTGDVDVEAGDLCPTLRLLAAAYAGHESYREEWAA